MVMTSRYRALLVLVLASLAVAVACAGSAEPITPAAIGAEADQTDQVSAVDAADEAPDEGAFDDDEAVESQAVAIVTGAPVPPPAASTAQVEALQTTSGGRFPPLNDPRVVLPETATWLDADTLVLGAVQNDDARAYPVFMMTFHHVANDVLGGAPYLVTF